MGSAEPFHGCGNAGEQRGGWRASKIGPNRTAPVFAHLEPRTSHLSRLHYVRVTAGRGFGAWALDSTLQEALEGESPLSAVRGHILSVKWNFSKKSLKNSALWREFDHICVLFVQHPSEKGLSHAFRGGSFAACAGVLGNCDLATEGASRGRPVRWFA